MTPGIRYLSSGSSNVSNTTHSHSCRGFAPSTEIPDGRAVAMRSIRSPRGTSVVCGDS